MLLVITTHSLTFFHVWLTGAAARKLYFGGFSLMRRCPLPSEYKKAENLGKFRKYLVYRDVSLLMDFFML